MIQSIVRAAQILNLFRDTPQLGVSQIAQQLGLPKTTAFGLVQTLCQENFLARDPETHEYKLGIAVFELGTVYESRLSLRDVAAPFLQELYEEILDTVQLTVINSRYSVYLSKTVAPNNMTFATKVGARIYAHCGASGKAVLAYTPRAEVDRLYEGVELERPTEDSPPDYETLCRQLDATREKGYATDGQGVYVGLAGLAVPLFDVRGKVCAALSVSFAYQRFGTEYFARNVPLLKNTAIRISRAMGCPEKALPPEIRNTALY